MKAVWQGDPLQVHQSSWYFLVEFVIELYWVSLFPLDRELPHLEKTEIFVYNGPCYRI